MTTSIGGKSIAGKIGPSQLPAMTVIATASGVVVCARRSQGMQNFRSGVMVVCVDEGERVKLQVMFACVVEGERVKLQVMVACVDEGERVKLQVQRGVYAYR